MKFLFICKPCMYEQRGLDCWLRFVTIKACPHSPVMQMLHRALITCMSTVTRFSPFSNYTYIVTSCADQERRDPDPPPPPFPVKFKFITLT